MSSVSALPMLPPTRTSARARPARSIAPSAAVVVDLPLVPVIAAMLPRSRRAPSSSSPIIGTKARASTSSPSIHGTPGDTTMRSAWRSTSPPSPPSRSVTPAACRLMASAPSSAARLRSSAVTSAPRATSSRAAAMPDRANPTTTTRLPRSSKDSSLAYLSLIVVRLNSAKMNATIQKRMMICGSFQPTSSKW